ncbi:TrbI/VirB10 family protein [Thiotrichales bacterium 19S9-12]|nr:TrbI/VirB10 family protein [Thiotrichales bacterium 19S9-11]MCF6812175.1 TrbI/VirB10 family protein [Thiotrichales bacterium 19S9-12]
MSKDKQKFDLKGKLPKSIELNKKLIIVVGGTLALLVLLMVVFSANNPNDEQNKSNDRITQMSPQGADLNSINDVDYADGSEINKLLGSEQKTKIIEKVPAEIDKKYNQLQQQLEKTQAQLSQIQAKQRTETKTPQKPESPMDREAGSSSIFFPGGAPRPVSDKEKKEDALQKSQVSDKDNSPQAQNVRFMEGKVDKDVTNQNTIQKPISKYTIFAGSVIPAILQTKLVSNLPGTIVARVNQNVYDSATGQYLLIPKGSTLIGLYNSSVTYGQYQLQAKFVRLIRPDGSSIVLPNQMGVDDMGVSGLEDEVDNHWMQLIGAAALATVFNIPAVIAQNDQLSGNTQSCSTGDDGVYRCTNNLGSTTVNSAFQSIGETATEIGGKLVDRSMNIQPTIVINAGKTFAVMVTKDLILPPYQLTSVGP